ncbi:GNAT family N-acetyltransferase [Limobrevibacterium gyesilva]|uniref:GNAT family N-acetyltransferase n=1 Tax=Limobrevibacterium gyesilva TaxID=2991712 RepID=A0AA41YJC2_9PROT|nr:GNAT family N-acetyltransferase [Limobrevibacterium gyesilva]MCW3473625.1 GNAT family N-acetyltransferase [Limobrevibacterium gyesilva]
MPHDLTLPGGYVVSDDPARLDIDVIHRYLSEDSYWARGRERAVTERSLAHSLCFGLYAPDGSQAGFARIVSDLTTSAHLADVFVLPAHRGRGLGKALVAAVLAHPELQTVRRWTLTTSDAHGLYAAFGFTPHPDPQTQMVRVVSGQGGANCP